VALGATPLLAAPSLQSTAPETPPPDEPSTLPRCSDLSLPPRPSADATVVPPTGAGVQEAPGAGLSAEEQRDAAAGASTGGFTSENGPEVQSGTGPIPCADSAAAP